MPRNIDGTFYTWVRVHYAYSFKLRTLWKKHAGKRKTKTTTVASGKKVEMYKCTYVVSSWLLLFFESALFFESMQCLHSQSRHHSIFMAALAHFHPFFFEEQHRRVEERKKTKKKTKNFLTNVTQREQEKINKMEKSYNILIYFKKKVKSF